jgi:hypothetical protein
MNDALAGNMDNLQVAHSCVTLMVSVIDGRGLMGVALPSQKLSGREFRLRG